MTLKPHPKNSPGPFYVVDGCCITCMAPHHEAPTLMGLDDVATALRDKILGESSEYKEFKVTPIQRKGKTVVFDYSWYEDNYYSLNFERGEPSTNRWLVHHSTIWKVGSVGLSLSIDDWVRSDSLFSNFRWYTADAWLREGPVWQETPY